MIDIAVNLTDPMFRGIYRGKQAHQDDIIQVIKRAKDVGVVSMIVTGVDVNSSKDALKLAQTYGLYCTAGVHPTHANEWVNSHKSMLEYLQEIYVLIGSSSGSNSRIVAVGECGLDYDRLNFCGREQQIMCFEQQLQMLSCFKLPFFLHCRNAAQDFVDIV